ncbi:carbohydrate ABC transporter permease [Thermotoga sp. SG1]|uniref:carbohydrate ABC transporter permease n=1 Tax=Thermotoga sp. SG1 TaxID=126739 RepID=UPI000C783AF4|nr:sugar ABC transporter permease [Thermotoga sp. SG1]PLV57448.1 ABC transporter permease [Thermotoga sp. SG1]
MGKRKNVIAYLFVSPWIIGFILFTGGPILAVILLSFCKWDLIAPPRWVGLENYIKMFRSESEFWMVLKFTLFYTLLSVIVSVGWALFTALLLNQKVKGVRVFSFFYFVPAVVPMIALTFAFQLIFNKELGVVNYLLTLIRIRNTPNWLMDPNYVTWLVAVLNIYTFYTGQMMLIFDSALKEVPKELYEAAEIDGAGPLTRFFRITLPTISPILLFNLVTATINSLSASFTLIYPLTGGGPGKVTQAISLDIYYNAFKTFRLGYASAEAVILFCISAVVSLLMFILSKKWVYYEV